MKRAVCLLVGLIVVGCLAACQPTPQKTIITGKTGSLEKKILQPAVTGNPMLVEISETWQEETKYTSGVKLIIDAQIVLPDVNAFPVVEVTSHQITLDEAQNYVNVLLQGQPIFEHNGIRSKSDWEEDILRVKADIEYTKNRKDIIEETRKIVLDSLNSELDYYEEQYQSAPEEKPEQVPATLVSRPGTDMVRSFSIEADLGRSRPATLEIVTPDDGSRNWMSFFCGDSVKEYRTQILQDPTGMALSRQKAITLMDEFLQSINVTDMYLAYTEILADPSGYSVSDPLVLAGDPKIKKCYTFYYCPVIYGIPVMPDRFFYGLSGGPEQYDEIWGGEKIIARVDNDGLYWMEWYDRGDSEKVLNKNVELLDFTQIKDIFQKQMFYQRTWVPEGMEDTTITIETVKLGMMRVRVKENRYVYLPVWDFVGDWTYIYDGIQDGMYDVSFMTINAIDGSIIDRNLGY